MKPHEIADKYGVAYVGDASHEYGGTYYDLKDWARWGYASYVDVIDISDLDNDEPFDVAIECGTINVPSAKDGRAALECCGWNVRGILGYLDAIKAYKGGDADDHGLINSDNAASIPGGNLDQLVENWVATHLDR